MIIVLILIICALVFYILSEKRDRRYHLIGAYNHGYDQAVYDMIHSHIYWDQKEDRYVTVYVMRD